MTGEIGVQWIKDDFDPQTSEVANGHPLSSLLLMATPHISPKGSWNMLEIMISMFSAFLQTLHMPHQGDIKMLSSTR